MKKKNSKTALRTEDYVIKKDAKDRHNLILSDVVFVMAHVDELINHINQPLI